MMNLHMSFEADLRYKLNVLYNSNDPTQLITDSVKRCWDGSKHLNNEQIILPLGAGLISGYMAIQHGKAALINLRRGHLISALVNTAFAGFTAYSSVYSLNNLANVTYNSGRSNWRW